MKKLTAVDILYKFLYEMESFNGLDPYNFNHKELFKQAKAMEKNQIKNAYRTRYIKRFDSLNAEQYYNEKFK